MTNLALAVIAVLLWGGAYGAYFAPELRRWWRRRRGLPVARRPLPPPYRARPARPRGVPTPLPMPVAPRPAPIPAVSNVIPFPRRPRR